MLIIIHAGHTLFGSCTIFARVAVECCLNGTALHDCGWAALLLNSLIWLLILAAGLVKVLRRSLRDMASKSSSYVEQCVKAEKDLNQEVSAAVQCCVVCLACSS